MEEWEEGTDEEEDAGNNDNDATNDLNTCTQSTFFQCNSLHRDQSDLLCLTSAL